MIIKIFRQIIRLTKIMNL